MEYTIQPDETVSTGIVRIVDGKVDTALGHIDGSMRPHETVHEVRKRCKEVRAALRLVRGVLPTYSDENAHYRDAARRISDIRDATALIETFDDHVEPAVVESGESNRIPLDAVRDTLLDRRETVAREQDIDARIAAVREDLVDGSDRIEGLPIATDGYDAVEHGLHKSYRRARNRMADAYDDPSTEAYHTWRKRVKYHRYHCRLLRSVWPGPMKARRDELKTLSDVLGDEHDLAVFLETMHDESLFDESTRRVVEPLIADQRAQLRREARPVGERLFTEKPDRLTDRIGGYWEATREYDSV